MHICTYVLCTHRSNYCKLKSKRSIIDKARIHIRFAYNILMKYSHRTRNICILYRIAILPETQKMKENTI